MSRRVVVEHPVVADPTAHLDALAAKFVAERYAVVAGAEDEGRDLTVLGQERYEPADLSDAGSGRVLMGHWQRPRRPDPGV
ncbi:MAG: hypothetical protein ACYCTL_08310 [Acidimicrobiales bacterium]